MVEEATASATDDAPRVNRKSRVGTVVSDRNDKTIVVSVQRTTRHRIYRKVIRRSKRYHVHDEHNDATVGDLVRIEESRPYSRLKRWRLVEVLTERQVAEVAPEELDEELVDEVQRSAARAAAEAAEAAGEGDAGTEVVVEAEDTPAAEVDADAPAAEADEPVEAEAPAEATEAEAMEAEATGVEATGVEATEIEATEAESDEVASDEGADADAEAADADDEERAP